MHGRAGVEMATRKKSARKKKQPAKNAPARRPAKAQPPKMSADERRRKLKPRDNYDELVSSIARALRAHSSVRVPGLTIARLEKLLRDAERAKQRELDARAELERKLAPRVDARIVAEDLLWRAVLDVNASVKPYARRDAAVGDAFAFLTEALSGNRTSPEPPDEPAATG